MDSNQLNGKKIRDFYPVCVAICSKLIQEWELRQTLRELSLSA